SGRGRHTRWPRDWSSDVCSSDLTMAGRSSKINGPRKLLAHATSAAAVSSAAATKIPARLESGGERKILPLACTMNDLHYLSALRSEERRVGKERRSLVERSPHPK